MSRKNPACDVFLAASHRDMGVAEVVRRAFEEAGLIVFPSATVPLEAAFEDPVREALAESRAFVVLLTRSFLNSGHLGVWIGGALAWNKPIYLLLEGLAPKDVPSFFKSDKVVPIAKLAEVVAAVARSSKPLSEWKRDLLGQLYADLGVSSDQLALQPTALDQLTRNFNEAAATKLSAERVLQEVVRLRKQGQLPRRPRRPRIDRKP